MKKSQTLASLCLALAVCLAAAAAAGGEAGDPLISLSYLEGAFSQSLEAAAEGRLDAGDEQVREEVHRRLEAMAANLAAASGQALSPQERTLKQGDVLTGSTGLVVTLLAGEAVLTADSGGVVDVTEGREALSGQALPLRHRCIAAEDALVSYTVTSPTAVVSFEGPCALTASAGVPDYFAIASALRELDLFRGTGSTIGEGFDLHLAPTRGEGLVMFIRLLGEESDAVACTYTHPFADVPAWLDRYVAWAYQRGYANGVAPTRFAPATPLSAVEYQEFLLRALGYSIAGVHDYSTSLERALDCGALTNGEYVLLTSQPFSRAHVAYVSYYSLETTVSGSRQTLAQRLEEARFFTETQLNAAKDLVNSQRVY